MIPFLDLKAQHSKLKSELMEAASRVLDSCAFALGSEVAGRAHLAEYKGRRAGSIGLMSAFSFYPGKNLGACGEGGAFVTSDPELIKKVRMLRDWGQEKRYHHVLEGYNYRMDGIQGAF